VGTGTLISLDEYLNTSYEPDMEFANGVLVRRNVGTPLHGWLQAILAGYFRQFRNSHRIRTFTEARMLVDAATSRYRIPDVMVLEIPYQKGKVVVDAPAIVVEIKSPDDTFDGIVDKCFEYDSLSIPNIVVMDPENRRGWLFRQGGLQLLTGGTVGLSLPQQHKTIDFPFDQMFGELDED
jgi:Uma2 family endonuclease